MYVPSLLSPVVLLHRHVEIRPNASLAAQQGQGHTAHVESTREQIP